MKTLFTLQFLLLSLVPFASSSQEYHELVFRDGIAYEKFSDVPFSGELDGQYIGKFVNGREEGLWIYYYYDGNLWKKYNFKNGKKEGYAIKYWMTGQLYEKGYYKNDKKEGRWVYYSPEGEFIEKFSGIFKDGVKISN